jgi:hypothetical protein
VGCSVYGCAEVSSTAETKPVSDESDSGIYLVINVNVLKGRSRAGLRADGKERQRAHAKSGSCAHDPARLDDISPPRRCT